MSKVKKKRTFFNFLELIVDIIVYPVMIISFASSFFMIVARSNNLVMPIFGNTFVRVLSGSMSEYCDQTQRAFFKDDIVLVRQKSTYNVGDVIAFYYYKDSSDSSRKFDLTQVERKTVELKDQYGNVEKDQNGNAKTKTNDYCPVVDENNNVVFDSSLLNTIKSTYVGDSFMFGDREYKKTAPSSSRKQISDFANQNVDVYFHQVVKIQVDCTGSIFYITKGTHNNSIDSFPIREDFVVGSYITTPTWLTAIVSFCSSSVGMLTLVVVPTTFIVFIELLSILEQINNILLEKKVIAREIAFDTKECAKAHIGLEMRDVDKIYYYDVMPPDYKQDVFNFLWGMFKDTDNKKQATTYQTALQAIKNYDVKNTNKYYNTWAKMFESNRKLNQLDDAQYKANQDRYKAVLFTDYINEKPENNK